MSFSFYLMDETMLSIKYSIYMTDISDNIIIKIQSNN